VWPWPSTVHVVYPSGESVSKSTRPEPKRPGDRQQKPAARQALLSFR